MPTGETIEQLSCWAMVGDLLQPTHLLFVLVVALLVLGPKRLPEAGRALGRGLRDFRHAISGEDQPEQTIPQSTTQDAPAPPASPAAPPPQPNGETEPAAEQNQPVAAGTTKTEPESQS